MAVKRPAYIGLAGVCLLGCMLGTSCQQIVTSYMQERQKARYINDSLEAIADKQYGEEDEKPLAEGYKVIERKKSGADSIYLVRQYYEAGPKAIDALYKGDVRDGLSTTYFMNGKAHMKVMYSNGAPYNVLECESPDEKSLDFGTLQDGTGTIKFYDMDHCTLSSIFIYQNGQKNGAFTTYYKNGSKKQEGFFVADGLEGDARAYFRNGRLFQTGHFKKNLQDGSFITYFESGKVKRHELWQNGKLLSAQEYNEAGLKESEEKLVDGRLLKIKQDYYQSGSVRMVSRFADGFKSGNFDSYYEKGNLRSREVWRNDSLLSETTWHDNGKIKSEVACKNSEREGIYREYYSNGGLRQEQKYHDGKKNGKFTSYYKNGKVYTKGAYIGETPSGKFEIYAEDGTYKGANTY